MKKAAAFDAYSPEYYGFEVGIMKQIKVCKKCTGNAPPVTR